ncbi:hypothetical protein [Alistipes sp.]|uniref:hypothetical protein n=1 Tax=Alistipes sp. TaxID=1872444 RepID=UPI000E9524D6|nr:hypothetical protein [Alistipes sp.]HBX89994.1 hypothetical protein [Alistipes sp.]HCN13331.1 hypothetical protein [Alistipes sp.]
MKKILLLCGLLCGAAWAASAACPSGTPGPELRPEGAAGKIYDYFAASLEGRAGAFAESARFDADRADAVAAEVWELWKRAVEAADTVRLPRLAAHADVRRWDDVSGPDGSWSLPDGAMDYLYASKGDRPGAGYPLFVHLHGSGDALPEWRAGLAWCHTYADAPSAYFIPRSPRGGTGCRWFPPSRQLAWERLMRQAFVAGEVDPARLYFIGISEGGYGSQRLASFYADYLAGAGPTAGGEQLFNAPPENCAHVAFCLQTGAEDTMYGRSRLTPRAAAEWAALAKAHPGLYVHKIDLQPGRGHGCDYTVTTPWLGRYLRTPAPKYFYWERFGMGDALGEPRRYREGFYNLRVVEPSDDGSDPLVRTCYEMTVGDDNTIDLRVRVVRVAPCEAVSEDGWTMDIGVRKSYAEASKGRVRIYLDSRLVDLSKPVAVRVNGRERFRGRVEPELRHLVESCALFFDPLRLFPAAVEVDIR